MSFAFAAEAEKTQHSDDFTVKIAVVDVQSVLENSLVVRALRSSIEEINKKMQQELSQQELELKEIEDDLIKKRDKLSEIDFEKELSFFNHKVNLAQQKSQLQKSQLEKAYAEAMAKVHEATLNIIKNFSQKNKRYNLVLPSSQILFAADNLNITSQVIDELNKSLSDIKINY
jgi:Skp family chaperone for outer membrane proteins